MDTSSVALLRPATNSEPVLLSLEEAEAVGAGIGPMAAGFVAGFVAVGASLAVGAAAGVVVGVAGTVAYNAATSSDSDDKKPIIAPGT